MSRHSSIQQSPHWLVYRSIRTLLLLLLFCSLSLSPWDHLVHRFRYCCFRIYVFWVMLMGFPLDWTFQLETVIRSCFMQGCWCSVRCQMCMQRTLRAATLLLRSCLGAHLKWALSISFVSLFFGWYDYCHWTHLTDTKCFRTIRLLVRLLIFWVYFGLEFALMFFNLL